MPKLYIIDEEELAKLLDDFTWSYDIHKVGELEHCVKDFLKDKKPVEEVASGYIFYNEDCCIDIGDRSGNELMPLQMLLDGRFKGKNIKVYIEVI